MKINKYFGVGAVLVLFACNAETKTSEKKDSVDTKTEKKVVNKVSFKDDKVQGLYTSYISLKNALVATKMDEAKNIATSFAEDLKNYSGCENTALIAHKIENAKTVVEQRKEFTALSTDVIALFKNTELSSGTIFVQHCPMANKGDGGDWLSSEKKIENPYYGSAMMDCGAVVEEIKTK